MAVVFKAMWSSLGTAFAVYGAAALATVAYPALGAAKDFWMIFPLAFLIQLALKLLVVALRASAT